MRPYPMESIDLTPEISDYLKNLNIEGWKLDEEAIDGDRSYSR
jgi:hypothetical protein